MNGVAQVRKERRTRSWLAGVAAITVALGGLTAPAVAQDASHAPSEVAEFAAGHTVNEAGYPDAEILAPAKGTGTVKANSAVNIRRGPHSGYYSTNGSYPNGTTLTLLCKTFGQKVTGPAGTTNRWYKTAGRKYVSGGYLVVTKTPGNCTEPTGDDYPWSGQCPTPPGVGNERDTWNYTKGQCTSFVAFRAQGRLGKNLSGLGQASEWNNRAPAKGISVGTMPLIGAVAVSESGTYGHVAYVTKVNSDFSFTVEEYNYVAKCKHGVRANLTLANSSFSSFIYP